MKLIQIDLPKFGSLENLFMSFSPGWNFILAPDEKTPHEIKQAVISILYGFSKEDSSGILYPGEMDPYVDNFKEGSINYKLDNGEIFMVTRQLNKIIIRNVTNGHDITSYFSPNSLGEIHLLRSQLGISKTIFHNTVYIDKNQFYTLQNLNDLIRRIRSIMDIGTEDYTTGDPITTLEEYIESIGTIYEREKPLGQLTETIKNLQAEKEKIQKKNNLFMNISSKIIALERKQENLKNKKNKMEKKIEEENLIEEIDKFKKIEELTHLCKESEKKLSQLKEIKDSLTEKASSIRDITRDFTGYLDKKDYVITTLTMFENTMQEMESSLKENEQTREDIIQKEQEIQKRIDKYSFSFGKFKDIEEFDSYMDEIEGKLIKIKSLNDKTMEMKENETYFSLKRKSAMIFLGLGFFLIFVIILLAIISIKHPSEYKFLSDIIIASTLLVLLTFYKFYKLRKTYIGIMRVIDKNREEIQNLKTSIDEAKQKLSGFQKDLGVLTTTDIRIKYDEYDHAKKDLESLRRITEIFKTKHANFGEASKLESEIREILEKCKHIDKDEPLSLSILKKFKEDFENALNLNSQQESLRREYHLTLDEIEKEHDRKTQMESELKSYQSDFDEHINKTEQYQLLDYFSELEELNITILEYMAEIEEKRNRISTLLKSERTLAEIDEEYEYNFRKKNMLEKKLESLNLAISIIKENRKNYATREFVPKIVEETGKILQELKLPEERKLLESLVSNLQQASEPVTKTLGLSCPDQIVNLYLIIKSVLSPIITHTSEHLPMIIGEMGSTDDFSNEETFLPYLLSLSQKNQLIYFTSKKELWNKIKDNLRKQNITYQEDSIQKFLLMKA